MKRLVLILALVSAGCATTSGPRELRLGDYIGQENGHRYVVGRLRCPGPECAYVLSHDEPNCPHPDCEAARKSP